MRHHAVTRAKSRTVLRGVNRFNVVIIGNNLPNFLQILFMAATNDNFDSFNLLIIEAIN